MAGYRRDRLSRPDLDLRRFWFVELPNAQKLGQCGGTIFADHPDLRYDFDGSPARREIWRDTHDRGGAGAGWSRLRHHQNSCLQAAPGALTTGL